MKVKAIITGEMGIVGEVDDKFCSLQSGQESHGVWGY